MIPMRIPPALPLLLTALLLGAPPVTAAAPGDDPAALKGQVLDPAFMEKTRVQSAKSLGKADTEMLGAALLEIGEKQKNPANVPFLVSYTVQEEARHLRLLATWAAWSSAPDQALAGFLARADSADERESCRAIEAAGFVGAVMKDKSGWPKFAEVAKGARVQAGIEAARALNRTMDRRAEKDIIDAACNAQDNHVRKHLVWAVLDFEEGEKPVARLFEGLRAKPGDTGKNASECAQIVLDKQATPFKWRSDALKDAGGWWKTGRPKGLQPEIAIKDDATKLKINEWLAEMKKEVPGWESYVRSVLHRIAYRADKDFEIFNLKKMTINIETSEVIRCESPWQGGYVLARDAGIAFSAQFGEPSRDHRGWEPAYADLYSYMKSTKHTPGKFAEFIDEALAKKPWP
jgi:hypothetical protein